MNAHPEMEDDKDVARARLVTLLGGFKPTSFRINVRRVLPHALPATRVERLDLVSRNGVRVRAILTGPDREWRDCPAVLYCHAHGNRYDIGASELIDGRPALLSPPYAQALAQAGAIALCIDLPCFGERQSDSESATAKRHLWNGTTLFGAMLGDLSGAVTVLGGIDGVDPTRISAFGLSMGATLAFWLGALDTRIAAVAQLCCFCDLATLVDGGGHDLHGIYMMVPGLLGAFSTGEIAGLIAPRPQLIGVGRQDPLTPPAAVDVGLAQVRKAYEQRGAASALRIVISPGTGHVETPAMRAAVIASFETGLHLLGGIEG